MIGAFFYGSCFVQAKHQPDILQRCAGRALSEVIEPGNENGVIVFIVSDGGWKYLSTGAYSGDLETVADALNDVIYF